MEHVARRDEVSGYSDQCVREPTALEAIDRAVEKRGGKHRPADESLNRPFPRKGGPARGAIAGESSCAGPPLTHQSVDRRIRGHLSAADRGVDAFAGEGIEEVRCITDQQRAIDHDLP